MPFRLILVLLLVVFEAAFIGFNLENVCDVWLFKVYKAVPVYITVLISFVAGALLSMLILAFGRLTKRARMRAKAQASASAEPRKEKKLRGGKSLKETRAGTYAAYSPPAEIGANNGESLPGPDSYGGGFRGNG